MDRNFEKLLDSEEYDALFKKVQELDVSAYIFVADMDDDNNVRLGVSNYKINAFIGLSIIRSVANEMISEGNVSRDEVLIRIVSQLTEEN